MNGVSKEQFELQKIKILKGASGVEIEFNIKKEDGGSIITDKYSKETSTFPHPDLLTSIDSLKDILVKAIGKETIHTERVIAGLKHLFKKEETYLELERALDEHIKGENTKITVTGIAVSGIDTNKGAIITGTYVCKNGAKIALNSPRIRYKGENFEFEIEFAEICQRIEEEAFLYTFKNKQAQAEIVFDNEETH